MGMKIRLSSDVPILNLHFPGSFTKTLGMVKEHRRCNISPAHSGRSFAQSAQDDRKKWSAPNDGGRESPRLR